MTSARRFSRGIKSKSLILCHFVLGIDELFCRRVFPRAPSAIENSRPRKRGAAEIMAEQADAAKRARLQERAAGSGDGGAAVNADGGAAANADGGGPVAASAGGASI
jgi:hypothetical protein